MNNLHFRDRIQFGILTGPLGEKALAITVGNKTAAVHPEQFAGLVVTLLQEASTAWGSERVAEFATKILGTFKGAPRG